MGSAYKKELNVQKSSVYEVERNGGKNTEFG